MKLPLASKRDYVVMNAHDFSRQRWYCKSIQIPAKYPGCSSYLDGTAALSGEKIRMAYNVVYAVESGETLGSCYLRVVQWLDIGGWMSKANKGANLKYLELFIKRAGKTFPCGERPKIEVPLK